jgi:hypothetical protein
LGVKKRERCRDAKQSKEEAVRHELRPTAGEPNNAIYDISTSMVFEIVDLYRFYAEI